MEVENTTTDYILRPRFDKIFVFIRDKAYTGNWELGSGVKTKGKNITH